MKHFFSFLIFIPVCCFGQWTQIGNQINGQNAGDRCGWSTAISADGTVVAMGSIFNQNVGSGAGQVRVFGWTNEAWTQIGADLNAETGGDQTGQAVSLSSDGSIVAIGEPFNNDLGFTAGQVRVFQNINNEWSHVGQDLYGESTLAGAGTSVDLSDDGSILAFGAPNSPASSLSGFIGKVEVYEQQDNNWVQRGVDIEGDGLVIKFGQGVSLSADGNIIAISQTGDPTNSDTGRVKVYEYTDNQWVQLGSTIFGTTGNDEFGYEVSLSAGGNILAIGSYTTAVVKVFEFINGDWVQLGNTLTGENNESTFGFSLSLSASGSILAVGDRFNSIDGNQTGRAYVFENQNGDWSLIDDPIVGTANEDQLGFSIALSQDGSKVSIGSIKGENESGFETGNVRVFENTKLTSTQDEIISFLVYPNPTNDLVNFSSASVIDYIAICNVMGQKVFSKEINTHEFVIDMSLFSDGTYMAQIMAGQKSQSIKLQKSNAY